MICSAIEAGTLRATKVRQAARCLCLLSVIASPAFAAASNKDAPEEATEILRQAASKMNIFELTNLELSANLTTEVQGKPVEGDYHLEWQGPDRWREVLRLPGYTEVQIGGKGVIWIKRPAGLTPRQVFWVHTALGFASSRSNLQYYQSLINVVPGVHQTLTGVRQKSVRGKRAKCVEMTEMMGVHKIKREVCIDENNFAVLRQDPFRDADYSSIESKIFPRETSYIQDGVVRAKVKITELKTGVQFFPYIFTAPTEFSSSPGCMNPEPPHPTRSVHQHYPEQDREARRQGTVTMDVLLRNDGTVGSTQVISGVSPTLNEASVNAIQQWRYEPVMCKGVPVESETMVEVIYTLSGY